MAAPSEKERAALKLFRHRISDLNAELDDYMQHDQSLLRFIRAREMDLDRAEDMLRKHLIWRKENNMDDILDVKLPQVVEEGFPYKASGFDKEGYLVATIPFGQRWDLRRAMDSGYRQEFCVFVQQIFEQTVNFCKYRSTKEKCLTQIVLVVDYEGFSLRQIASREVLEVIFDCLKMFEANYPETLKTCWIVNIPTAFSVLFKLVKPLLSAHTLSKIRIFGSNQVEWRSALLKEVDPSQLPSSFGGSNTSCMDYKMNHGFDIFKTHETFPEDDLKSVTVLAGQKFRVDLYDIDVGTQIAWNFKTETHNVGFSVSFGDDNEEVVEYSRTDSHLHLQKGSLYCEKAGTYTLIFDNTFSKFRAKKLQYTVAKKNPNKFILN